MVSGISPRSAQPVMGLDVDYGTALDGIDPVPDARFTQPGHARGPTPKYSRSFTLRAVLAGLFLGLLVNVSNLYYGLRVGAGSQMSMVSGLLGYAGFKLIPGWMATRLTPEENVLVISVATATGCMALTAGLIGAIPALEYLIGPDENGPMRQDLGHLIFWSIGLCFFGIIFTALLREHFIEREQLPWPGARATAHLINTLHRTPPKLHLPTSSSSTLSLAEEPGREEHEHPGSLGIEPQIALPQGDDVEWKSAVKSLVRAATASGIMAIIIDFIPILHKLPIFGRQASGQWLWNVDLSPGFFGQGMIIGPSISLHMLVGAIVGWGILSPYAKHRGWAPGEVDDWESGSRGWIIWVSLASLLADASVKLAWFILQPHWRDSLPVDQRQSQMAAFWGRLTRREPSSRFESRYIPIPSGPEVDSDSSQTHVPLNTGLFASTSRPPQPVAWRERTSSLSSRITPLALGLGFLASLIVCTLAVHIVFGKIMPWYYTPLAIGLSLPMATVGIRSIAETDYNPESAIVSQLVFAALISHSNPNAVIINLISAAMAVAGANQAGDLAYDLKVGSIIGARPDAQVLGQIIGSLFGALVSCGVYKLYASQYPIPGPLFRVPSAYLVLSTARLLLGRGLPEGVWPFAVAAAVLSTLSTVMKMRYEDRWWQKLIPSGVSFAIGIYLLPSFSITRVLGGLFYWAYTRRKDGREGNIIVPASGLVLGESLASLVNVALAALHTTDPGAR